MNDDGDGEEKMEMIRCKRAAVLTSETNDSDLLVVEFGHELPREDLHDVRAGLGRAIVVVQHKQRLDVHAQDATLQVLALDGAEEVDFVLLEATKHDGRNGDVGCALDVAQRVVVGAPAVQDDDLLLRTAAPKLLDQAILVDQIDLRVGHLRGIQFLKFFLRSQIFNFTNDAPNSFKFNRTHTSSAQKREEKTQKMFRFVFPFNSILLRHNSIAQMLEVHRLLVIHADCPLQRATLSTVQLKFDASRRTRCCLEKR